MAAMRRPLSVESLAPDSRLFAAAALATALLTVLLLATPVGGQAGLEPGELLTYFRAHRGRYVLSACLVLAWVVLAIPFVVALREVLAAERRALGLAALLLAAGGLLLMGFGGFIGIGAFFALDAASEGLGARLQAPYQAAIWRSMSYLLTDPGLMLLGAGQVLFAWLAWRTTLSRILSVIGLVGGVAGLLTLAVYQTPLLAMAQLGAFALWAGWFGLLVLHGRWAAEVDAE
jgi:hypothetical protein